MVDSRPFFNEVMVNNPMTRGKQAVTIRFEPYILEFIDYNAQMNNESRSAIINHIARNTMKEAGISVPPEEIVIGSPAATNSSDFKKAADLMRRVR